MAKKTKEIVEIDKKEINNYIDEQVKKYFSDEIEKANKKVIRYKNRKILFRNIVIVLLLIVILYLLHVLYTLDYFNDFINPEKNIEIKEKKQVEKKEPTMEELKEKYSNYLDIIKISDDSEYLKLVYEGKLTNELKLYLCLNNLNIEKFGKEKDYNIIEEELIKKEYSKLFEDDYKGVSFNYNGTGIKYISKMKSYITNDILIYSESNIRREITDIKENSDEVTITTIEGIVKDDVLYNSDNVEIDDFDDNSSLLDYEEDLEKVEYIFVNKKLKEIR